MMLKRRENLIFRILEMQLHTTKALLILHVDRLAFCYEFFLLKFLTFLPAEMGEGKKGRKV